MAENEIKVRLQSACKTLSEWESSNPIPKKNEVCYVKETGNYKIGNGTDNFKALPYGQPAEHTHTWSQITSKPDTYTPSAHTHAIGDVTNLQSSLDSKVPVTRKINGKALNADITLSASDVGASASGHTHNYLPLAGGAMGAGAQIKRVGASSSWVSGRRYALIRQETISGYCPAISIKTTNGSWDTGVYTDGGYADKLIFSYVSDENYDNGNNTTSAQVTFTSSGYVTANNFSGGGASLTSLNASNISSGTLSSDRLPIIPVSKGGTGLTSLTSGQALIGNGTGNITTRAIDTTSGGTSGSTSLITSGAVYSGLNGKSDTGHTHNSILDAGNNTSAITFAYSKSGLNYSDYTWLAGWTGYELRAINKNQFATASHTHNYAGSSSAGGAANSLAGFTNTTTSSTAIDSATQNGHVYVSGTSGIYSQADGAAFVQAYSASWVAQIYQDYRTGQIALRGKNNGTWQAWRKVLLKLYFICSYKNWFGSFRNMGNKRKRKCNHSHKISNRKNNFFRYSCYKYSY